jgi:hypothetical protein
MKEYPTKFRALQWTCSLKGVVGCVDQRKIWKEQNSNDNKRDCLVYHCSECSYVACYACSQFYGNHYEHSTRSRKLEEVQKIHVPGWGSGINYASYYHFSCYGEHVKVECT